MSTTTTHDESRQLRNSDGTFSGYVAAESTADLPTPDTYVDPCVADKAQEMFDAAGDSTDWSDYDTVLENCASQLAGCDKQSASGSSNGGEYEAEWCAEHGGGPDCAVHEQFRDQLTSELERLGVGSDRPQPVAP